MMAVWSLRLLPVLAGTLLIASTTADVQQMDGPIIVTPSQKEMILQSGQNYTLICRGKRPLRFMQQEIPEEIMGDFVKEERNETYSNGEYEMALDLYNVDHFAVGYYACFDDSVDSTEVISNIIEEPNNTAHIAYVYIYVNGSYMFAPMRALVLAKGDSKFLVECRPTTPDIKVKLTVDFADTEYDQYSYNPKIGFTVDSEVLLDALTSIFMCVFMRNGNDEYKEVIVHKHTITQPPQPSIWGGSPYFLKNETFSINCTVITQRNLAVALRWKIPGPLSKVLNDSNEYAVTDENPVLYNNYTIRNASEEDAGEYTCMSTNSNGSKNKSFVKHFLGKPVIVIDKTNNQDMIEVPTSTIVLRVRVKIKAYPPANISFLRDGNTLPKIPQKYIIKVSESTFPYTNEVFFTIRQLKVADTGNYTIFAQNKNLSNMVNFDVRIQGPPVIDFGPETDKKYLINTTATLKCEATGYPVPSIEWIFSDDSTKKLVINKDSQEDIIENLYKITSFLEVPVRVSGNITCKAANRLNTTYLTRRFLVYEMPDGFGIRDSSKTWFAEAQNVELKCLASKYDFVNVSWYTEDEVEITNVYYSESKFSYIAILNINHITVEQAGSYKCMGRKKDGSIKNETITITVAETRLPTISDPEEQYEEVGHWNWNFNLTCEANAVPPPEIKWLKNLEPVLNSSNIKILNKHINHTAVSSMIKFELMQEENAGKYECRVTSQNAQRSKFYTLAIKEKPSHRTMYLSVIGVIFFILILLVAYLTWKIRKEKQFRKELAAAGLLYFKEGVTKSINPDLGIDEQAELLPYDEKFEFPAEKLILGKQLGAGAFGVVYKADARGIVNAEETTTVAVKMVKKTADNMYIKALASELKIMVHLGKHINIVNLLGACTKNVGKRELIVIVEYCKFGNIHNYLQKHREVFKDTLTDNQEKALGKDNRGFSSSGNSGTHSDYFGSTHTQDTDHTFLNTANTNPSGRKDNTKQVEFVKVSETGYVQPEWRSNYESDYSYDGRSPRPLFSRDLLAWSFQIARGMEYLASRKVLHGDLAARNILLADDNIVKICDFGLAKSIYKNDEYQKKENSPLPVKWLAIECMTDRIFSTQSDVWSFGIVLWELFTLAKTPYPNISPSQLLQWLSEGNRLEKPVYADDRLYDLMRRCWDVKPTTRPSFSQLQEILGSFLEDNVRNHYVDLNDTYMNLNKQRTAEEDYLAMVSAPDYNNLVTPSPHIYVNDSRKFFPPTPTQLQHDDEGYLQMSPASRQNSGIFNARPPGSKFDFDDRKLTPRVSDETSCGSELTPMLTLNNLPRSGSESDHEGNASPYLNMCPRIEEETDEVFEMKKNNAKNLQPSAVANPTYTYTFNENEKKPQDFTNSYSNINVPNGLVK